jgi:ligand-binding SRPBCC domain-containing protein
LLFSRDLAAAALKIAIYTPVKQDYLTVFHNFNQELFLALAPPFPKLTLLRFDGSQPGDQVAIELNFLLFRQTWTSLITESKITGQAAYFIDEGQQLPWPLKYWQHQHLVKNQPSGGAIIGDLIQYRTGLWLLDLLLYPMLLAQFKYRQPVYRQFFKA